MFGLDAFHLARVQFAFTVSFHIIFPAITIGLASYLAVLEGLWLKNKNPVWRSLLPFLVEDFRRQLRYGGRFRAGDGLPVRHQLERFLTVAGSITGPSADL